MRSEEVLANIDVAVLAGGLGSRLRGVTGGTPKVLAPVAGRAFLGHLLDHLGKFGARRVVLCLGDQADRVTAWLARGGPTGSMDVVCEIEPSPLGTAGALGYVRSELRSNPVLVMNGDTFLDADLRAFVAFHRLSGAEASLLCVAVEDAARHERVDVGPDGRLRAFLGKAPGPGTISAGVYLFSAAFLDGIAAAGVASLEHDVLAKAPPGSLHAHVAKARFVDLGAPESAAAAGGREP
ncbi:sugar phosphate nucleotidyltransferase [Azospirillum thermophilum]|uniref:Nucleotidyl transferase n=1 Tax=Azospirillum thermophilum TaxID=2202148 RepID=A0A2S2CM00_9PROT|nr:sugar phosphate nucleotidyltransferase [Azospirillum thermophilum]AWK85501.1 nucleotidyl transferase [Azospirillum thermophilum]